MSEQVKSLHIPNLPLEIHSHLKQLATMEGQTLKNYLIDKVKDAWELENTKTRYDQLFPDAIQECIETNNDLPNQEKIRILQIIAETVKETKARLEGND